MQEIKRNGAANNDRAQEYDRFYKLVIDGRAESMISRYTACLSGLANFCKKQDKNPYLMAFNPNEKKKYEAAKARLKEDYVFFKLMLGDLRRYKACIMRVEFPYNTGTKANKAKEKSLREQRNKEIEGARAEYQEAFNYAREHLPNTHSFALRIGLSFATMYYDFLDMPERAIELAQSIHRDVAPRVIQKNKDEEASVRNAALPVLQELEERLFLWTCVNPMDSQDPRLWNEESI